MIAVAAGLMAVGIVAAFLVCLDGRGGIMEGGRDRWGRPRLLSAWASASLGGFVAGGGAVWVVSVLQGPVPGELRWLLGGAAAVMLVSASVYLAACRWHAPPQVDEPAAREERPLSRRRRRLSARGASWAGVAGVVSGCGVLFAFVAEWVSG